MAEYTIGEVYSDDTYGRHAVNALLEQEGIRLDRNVDYTCAMYDEDMNVIATGSLFLDTLRCLAVSSAHQGESLMNQIVSHLVEKEAERGYIHLFLYTKCTAAKFFSTLGFYLVAEVPDYLVFMENRRDGFDRYLGRLKQETDEQLLHIRHAPAKHKETAAVVMNANPFTLGHRCLLERAAAENALVHVFLVSEDVSFFPFSVRKKLLYEGSRDIPNLIYHESGPYIISHATFPSYFQKSDEDVVRGHVLLDLELFGRIAHALQISRRYVGEEPFSQVTGMYNRMMREILPEEGIECVEIPRQTDRDGNIVSASSVREAVRDGDMKAAEAMLPESTYRYLMSQEALPVVRKIRAADEVVHY